MNPIGRTSQEKVPSSLIDIVSFRSPTVPCQCPTIFVEYAASETGDELFTQTAKDTPMTTTAMALAQSAQLAFKRAILRILFRTTIASP
jgi:hypothetical protein